MKFNFKIVNIMASLCIFISGAATINKVAATEAWLDFSVPEADVVQTDSEATDTSATANPTAEVLPDNNSDAGISAAELFATAKSPGSIAIGVAEGNLTVTGKTTSLYWGHTDPGNHVTNRGFCSWNRAQDLTVQQADRRCLAALQRQGAATEKKLELNGIDPKINPETLVNGTDLWNQSPGAGREFARTYKQAIAKGLKGKQATIEARVEAFRNESGNLDASGLFGICNREGYYQRKLAGLKAYSEAWRWQCIALDQGRRVAAVSKALKQNIQDKIASKSPVESAAIAESAMPEISNQLPRPPTAADPVTEAALDFSVPDTFAIASSPDLSKSETQVDPPPTVSFEDNSSLDFNVPESALFGNSGEETPPEILEENKLRSQQNADIFSGKRITKAGGAIGECRVTDYRRFRYAHPVPGLAPRWHNGIDVACRGGTHTVYSPADGKLTILQPNKSGGGGLVARIKTDDGWTIQNMHMLEITAKPGKIRAGQKLGIGGAPLGHINAGLSTGPHSHYERFKVVKGDRKYVNPTESELKALMGIEP